MKIFHPLWTMSLLFVFLFNDSGTFGADLTPKQKPKDFPQLQEAPQPPSPEPEAILGQVPNLTPQQADYSIVHVAQNPPAPQPVTQTVVVTDPGVHDELARLAAEIKAIKKDVKKPDTKKAWSSPKVGGRIFLDSVNIMDQNNTSDVMYGNMPNMAGFREIRLGVSGNGYDAFDYKIEMGYAAREGKVELIDNWVGVKNLPLLGYVRAGHFKPETGLYYPMSTNDVSLMEYATPASVFGLGRRIGLSSENLFAQDRVRTFFGVFQSGVTNQDRYLIEDNQGQVVNLRLTMAPVFVNEGKQTLHLGGHWEYVATDTKTASVSATPAAFSMGMTQTLRSGTFACDHYNRGGLEFAYQNGPFSVRSEGFAASYDAYLGQPTRNLFGAYVELGWFLTGEHRVYNLDKGGFGAVKMKRNFHPFKSGDYNLIDSFGAWQVVFQWGYTDLSDWRDVSTFAGYQNDIVLGLSWFWSPQLRWVFEYVHSMQSLGVAGAHVHPTEDIFGTGVRVHF